MAFPGQTLQQKIFERLNGDSTLVTTYGCRVADVSPDSSTYPLVQIGEDDLSDFSSHTFDGFRGLLRIHTWTQSHGMKNCKLIQARIYDLLHEWNPQVTGQKTISLRSTLVQTMLDQDGRTQHGINEFEIILGG